MEDAMMIHRIVRAPDKRAYYVNVGNVPPNEVENYMQRMISKMKKIPYVDPQTGQYNLKFNMQNLLEDGGYLYLKEKPGTSADRTMIPDSNFRLVFAGNTVGQGDTTGSFSGVGVQNTATIDRFTNTVRLSYLDMKHEIAIITSKTNVTSAVAAKMVKVAGLVRSAYDSGKVGLTMSPRTLINWARKQTRYTPEYALQVAFLEKLNIDDSKTVREFYTKVFGA
jgi:hypothetical protein